MVEAPGEGLPFDDASFDTVALTLVLCTAPDPRGRGGGGGAGTATRRAASSSSSTCARPIRAWPAGRTASTDPGTCSATAATATATRCARSRTRPWRSSAPSAARYPARCRSCGRWSAVARGAPSDGYPAAESDQGARSDPRTRLAAFTVAALALSAPAGAQAATLGPATAKPCYGTGDAVPLVGSGYTPSGAVQIARDGAVIGTATADAAGNFGRPGLGAAPATDHAAGPPTPAPTRPTPPTWAPSPPILLSQLRVGVRPLRPLSPRRPRRVRTRGWTLRGTRVFAHVRRGRYRRNFSVGKLKGDCRTSSKRVRLFGRGARPGVYRVQFDTFKRFKSKRAQRVAFRVTIFRTFRRSSASRRSAR